ncbi:MAG: hypothetical protein COA79_20805 [Planctomycetota bacterium]|nr:MAG: hypothetical protein COA79_20805 [Planctomycetota bacterium]
MNILIVDESIAVTNRLKNILKAKHSITTYNDMFIALKHLKNSQEFDVIIIDFVLPQINGKDLIDHVFDFNPDTAFIFMSYHFNLKFNSLLQDKYCNAQIIKKSATRKELGHTINRLCMAG